MNSMMSTLIWLKHVTCFQCENIVKYVDIESITVTAKLHCSPMCSPHVEHNREVRLGEKKRQKGVV